MTGDMRNKYTASLIIHRSKQHASQNQSKLNQLKKNIIFFKSSRNHKEEEEEEEDSIEIQFIS